MFLILSNARLESNGLDIWNITKNSINVYLCMFKNHSYNHLTFIYYTLFYI